MKFRLLLTQLGSSFAAFLLLSLTVSAAQIKPVRLRNQVPVQAVGSKNSTNQPSIPLSGLFLIQLSHSPDPQTREQLHTLGVDLLHYVPSDTYLARFQGTRLDALYSIPVVQWVGRFGPEHKVHQALQAKRAAQSTTALEAVSVLVAPRARPSEVAQVRNSLAEIRQETTLRSGTVIRGRMNPARLDSLAKSDVVLWIEPWRGMKLFDEVASKIVAGDGGPRTLLTQSLGYDGSGVAVAVADSGLNNGDAPTMHPDLLGRTPSFFHYGTLTDAADEHSHGTHVSGIIAGNGATGEVDENGALYGLGVAPGARIITQRIFDDVGGFEPPPSFERLTRDATRAGAVIGSNSWGDDTQGAYDLSAMEFDELVRDADALMLGDQPYILEFSAGNAGPAAQSIGSPAVAKNVIATGAVENDRPDFIIYADGPDAMADFSSRGPCEDGRIKPDIVAPGTWIASLQSASATDEFAWSPIDGLYQYQGGTSQAGPHASGAAAVFVQYYRQTHTNSTPSPALVKATLINSAVNTDDSFGTGPVPNMDEGWGRIDLTALFDPVLRFDFTDQTVPLTNTQVFEHHILVESSDEPLKITLAYTDLPAFPGAVPALVNDLDLEVIGPTGTIYGGNQFNNGESVPNAALSDRINNVEAVHLAQPTPGLYTIRVRAFRIVEDARQDTLAEDQDFALVVSGALVPAERSIAVFDRQAYRASDQIRIQVVDADQSGAGSLSVTLTSSSEPLGEAILLQNAGTAGVFTGVVATATGGATTDGKLQISNGDIIEVRYFDASANATRSAQAHADFLAPILSNPSTTNFFGQVLVSWTSDEPASSVVYYGTNASATGLVLSVTNLTRTTAHSVSLDRLLPGATYHYYIVSVDEAGNAATNNNSFSFVVSVPPPVLVVDEYGIDVISGTAPPLSGYTDVLNQIGIKYDVWIASATNEPTLSTLSPYRAVIWRVPDTSGVWSAGERGAISNYLNSGGALLVASMEVLSRLEEASATSFIHDVLQVQSYIVDPQSSGAREIIGSPSDAITSGLDIEMAYAIYEDMWGGLVGPDASDTLTASTNSSAILHNDVGDVVGLRWPGIGRQAPGRLVFLSFPLDAVPMGNGINDRINLMHNILAFLAPGAPGLSSLTLNSTAYGLPSVVTVEVGDAPAIGQGTVTVTARTTTQTNGISVPLNETATRGVFSGSFQLVTATNPPSSGTLRAAPGDTITVLYSNISTSNSITALAVVDTTPPVPTIPHAEPDYVTAVISWTTPEPTDALVEFGLSPFLDRTVYISDLANAHELTLSFLQPDQKYYYQTISRDAAGNSVVDDNHGQFYTFQTLKPILPPWFDNLDTGGTNWSTFTDQTFGSSPDWELGTPQNSLTNAAYSAPNAWGNNLSGEARDYQECFLISPAIYLTNGNVATLTFWHNYDFFDVSGYDIEMGEVLAVAADTGATASLTNFDASSLGWTLEKINLSAYAGKVVYLVWHYALLAFESANHPGWLVDDVSVTVSNVPPGTIQIVNNLWQSTYVLSGAAFQKGKGISATITNAPSGDYLIEYADLPYYITPPSQSTNLSPGGTVTFVANYTFPDINTNGISDLWEQHFFGNVSANRTRFTDSDGDGMTDFAEFMAGTDPNTLRPNFRISPQKLSSTMLRLEWPSVPGQQFQVQSSTNLSSWASITGGWFQATSTVSRLDISMPSLGRFAFFRVQLFSTNSPSNLAPNLKMSARVLANGQSRLDWNSSPGRAYQLQGSSNGAVWTPISSWTQATTASMSYVVPAPTPGTPYLFRVQVQP